MRRNLLRACLCQVGAGMLALPAVTAEAGFVASSAGLAASCVYAIITGLLVAEVRRRNVADAGIWDSGAKVGG